MLGSQRKVIGLRLDFGFDSWEIGELVTMRVRFWWKLNCSSMDAIGICQQPVVNRRHGHLLSVR